MAIPLYLDGKSMYKLSMSNLFIKKKYPLLGKLKDKSWLVLDGSAKAGQGELFKKDAKRGDYVYACVGSRELWGIYRLTGDWSSLPDDITALLPAGNEWGYRAAELVVKPVKGDIWNIKNINKHWAPSGFSTFYEVNDLAGANQHIFEPFFDRTLVPGPPPGTKPPVDMMPRNQIIYGPPGTGKTYHTTARAVALLEGISDEALAIKYPKEKRAELRQKFEDFRAAGRIAFVTFHQAFTYEDFVEGIKPILPKQNQEAEELEEAEVEPNHVDAALTITASGLQYTVRKGIFRQMCDAAADAVPTIDGDKAITVTPLSFEELYAGFLNQLEERIKSTQGPVVFRTKEGRGVQLISVNKQLERLQFQYGHGKEQSLVLASKIKEDGALGYTDKSHTKMLYELYPSIDQITNLTRDIEKKVGSPKTLYWTVFNELKKYEATRLSQQQDLHQTKPSPRFVLIIDEINRGNVANIFGELITLLEDDKRAGQPEAASVTLPYSQEEFSVPQNLYLLGTMNTADRSVEALDTALRRRFSFTEMLPDPALLPTDVEGVNVREMLVAINARLEQLLDHDHCIGHALLMRVTTLDGLREAFRRNILPLLQEYFFGDWGKIGLVLGGAFVQPLNKKQNAGGYALKKFDTYSVSELSEKTVYKLTDVLKLDAKAFHDIYAS